ncbi:MAG TPA: nucleotidyltransferase family protein [Solirubrobacteraceae bacterium]|nr:nucleotidyltransferase family protein [Solirubrobacteraceae bacterium]
MIAGLILAAGGASRFGSPKQLAELDGVPLLQHAVSAMVDVFAIKRAVVVLGARADDIREAVDFRGAETVVCDAWADGMAASLRCGIEALGDEVDWAIVTLGDQPRITPQVISWVTDEAAAAGDWVAAVRTTYDGEPGHPVALSRWLMDEVRSLRGDVGARELLAAHPVLTVEAGRDCRPGDVDTPEDLEELRA